MLGRILTYNPLTGSGVISGDDGQRYEFRGTEWQSDPRMLRIGEPVDFQANVDTATAVYSTTPMTSGQSHSQRRTSETKSPIAAGLLALFLGGFGIHKFYLGYNGAGIALLLGSLISWMLTIIIIGFLGVFAIGAICLVEAIIYLTKNEDEFNRIYVEGHRPWL